MKLEDEIRTLSPRQIQVKPMGLMDDIELEDAKLEKLIQFANKVDRSIKIIGPILVVALSGFGVNRIINGDVNGGIDDFVRGVTVGIVCYGMHEVYKVTIGFMSMSRSVKPIPKLS